MYENRKFRDFAPIKIGDELDVKIEAVGKQGDGIAKKDGFVLFVPNTKEGQNVRVKVSRVARKFGFAEVVEGDMNQPEEQAMSEPEQQQEAEDTEDFGEEKS